MKYFYLYSIVAAIMVLLRLTSISYGLPSTDFMVKIRNLPILFHFSFLGIFIYSIIPNKFNVKFSWFLFLIFLTVTLFYVISHQGFSINSASFSIANLSLVIFCIIYFNQLFKNISAVNLLQEPSFWVVSGILFCMSIAIPVISLDEYLRNSDYINLAYRNLFSAIVYFAYGSFHLFLVKAYLCSTIR
jgi:hypothetical protein